MFRKFSTKKSKAKANYAFHENFQPGDPVINYREEWLRVSLIYFKLSHKLAESEINPPLPRVRFASPKL